MNYWRQYVIGAAVGSILSISIAILFFLFMPQKVQVNITSQKDTAECERQLRAAYARGYTYSHSPFGYDQQGDPAIVINSFALDDNSITRWIVQNAECVASKGAWTDRPLNLIDSKHHTIATYNGVDVKLDREGISWACASSADSHACSISSLYPKK